jgi:predicted nucleic acid-binding Zn ribbon protein
MLEHDGMPDQGVHELARVGRIGDDHLGMQNFAWYRFDAHHSAGPIFHAHGSVPFSSHATLCGQCGKPYRPQRSDSRFCSDTCRQRAHRSRLAQAAASRDKA